MTQTIDATTLEHLQTWQGKSEIFEDLITPAPLRALSATLDREDPLPINGTAVPPLWHWLYFLPHYRQSEIGPDGHGLRGGFLPPVPLPRRMWAGGRLQWHSPMTVGDTVRRTSTISKVTHKSGRTGDLLFVLVKHTVHNLKELCLTEEHDIVYRPAANPTDPVIEPTQPLKTRYGKETSPLMMCCCSVIQRLPSMGIVFTMTVNMSLRWRAILAWLYMAP